MLYYMLLFIVAFMVVLSFYCEFISCVFRNKEIQLVSLNGILISFLGVLLSVVFASTMCKFF